MLKCKTCKRLKKVSSFYSSNKKVCISCIKKKYLKNRKKKIKESCLRQAEWRRKAIDVLGGPKCAECSCNVYSILEINHIDGTGHIDRKKNGMTSGKLARAIALGLIPLDNYEVLCKVCNQKHYVQEVLKIPGFSIKFNSPKNKKIVKKFKKS